MIGNRLIYQLTSSKQFMLDRDATEASQQKNGVARGQHRFVRFKELQRRTTGLAVLQPLPCWLSFREHPKARMGSWILRGHPNSKLIERESHQLRSSQ